MNGNMKYVSIASSSTWDLLWAMEKAKEALNVSCVYVYQYVFKEAQVYTALL